MRLRNAIVGVASFIAVCTVAAQAQSANSAAATVLRQARAALGAAALDRGGALLTQEKIAAIGLTGTGSSVGLIGSVRFAERESTPPLMMADGYDGALAWNQDQAGLVWVDGSDAGRSQEIDSAFASNDALFSTGRGGATVTWGGFKTDAGRRYATLMVTPPHSLLPMQLWIDTKTHLPMRYVVALGPITFVSTLSDFRPVDGLMVPYRTHAEESTGNTFDSSVTSARIELAGNDAALAKPASHVTDFSMTGAVTQTSVPIDVIDNHVYLDVMLDGKGPYRFIFDTGGSNLIDPAVAKEIGAKGAGSLQGGGAGSGTESFSFATVDSLQIGGAIVRNQVFSIAPVRLGFGISAGQRVDGLIGFEVLARFVTSFDYAGHAVTFKMPGASAPDGADVVPFVFGGSQPQIACTIDGVTSECSVDTGSRVSLSLFGPFIAAHPQVVPAARSGIGVNGFGIGGPAMGFLGRLASLQIGQFQLTDLVADFSTQKKGFFASPFLAANVGGGVWKRFTVTFDYGRQTMALQPNAALDARETYERAGLFLIAQGDKTLVYDVRPGTPGADAGIVKGDTIVAIDGKPPASLQQARDLLSGPAGSVLRLQIAAKDGMTRTVMLTLRDWV
jgi:Aspartyl protease/PDZ domain